ncbi:hypothetical protein COV19_05025 [Candidatus Woesearchaeota archaeon CG10_big_fil_rev_8_21_14_0_10_44_13]|nr:MAG: hypothetical protein COV19_05025 [Candidatus Woesearchaeota archaeon CG10_big_fil_rev_8_21_14_0_10_44_13]
MDDGLKKRLNIGADELLLFLLIISEIFEFAGLLPGDFDYVKKILSWVCLAYLLYKINLTEIIFGYDDRKIDIALIAAYFMLVAKDFILYSKEAMETIGQSSHNYLTPFYAFILDHAFFFQYVTFYIGGGIIILLALLNIFLNAEVKEPSIMAIFHKGGPAGTISERLLRGATSFIIYSAFFVIIFNLAIEWLGWAVDSTLAVLAVFFYLFFFIKHYKRLDPGSFLYKVGDAGEGFYGEFINLFRSKGTILLGISGLLVLHLLTDVGNFILPYILGRKIEYFVALGAGHTGIPSLMAIDLEVAATLIPKISVFMAYILNISAILFMLIGPALIWYEIYKKRRIEISNTILGLFGASIFTYLSSPIFKVGRISVEGLYGVDILTKTINVLNAPVIIFTAAMLFILFTLIAYSRIVNMFLRYIMVFAIELFFANYIYMFFFDVASFYSRSLIFIGNYFILFYLFIFLSITIMFYIGGIIYFIYDSAVDMTKKFI